MQSLVLLFLPFVLALTPADVIRAAEPVPFTDAVILAAGGQPARVLAAVRFDDGSLGLRVLEPGKGVVAADVLRFEEGKAPAFDAAALRELPEAGKLMRTHKLKAARPRRLGPHTRAYVSPRIEGDRERFVLVTAKGEEPLLDVPLDRARVRTSYDEAGRVVALAGSRDADADADAETPAGGVLVVRALPQGLPALTAEDLAAVLATEARLALAAERFTRAGETIARARKRRESPEVLFLSALIAAHRQEATAAVSYLDGLAALETDEAARLHSRALTVPVVREARLRSWDINGSDSFTFKASRGFEGTSVWVKIKDAQGHNVAIFKPTNGNTYHRGEVFTYQLAKLLGFSSMYPVTVLHTLDKEGCGKFVQALEKVTFKGMKERNRGRLIYACKRHGTLEGAVKEWVHDFQFFQAIGTTDRLKKHHIFRYLKSGGPLPRAGDTLRARTVTRLYKPDHCKKATYQGRLDIAQFALDLSNLLVMDVLNANEDRFPGANVDFRSVDGGSEVKTCVFEFGPARLFSLDNGATFKGTYSNGYVDFTKRLKPSRFSRRTFERLQAIEAFVEGEKEPPRFLAARGIATVEALSRYLALDKGDSHPRRKEPFKLFTANLQSVLKRMRRFAGDKSAWFEPVK